MYSFPPIAVAIGAVHAVVTGLVSVLDPFLGTASAAAAIIVLVIAVRTLLLPLGLAQARAERTRRRLAPAIAELRRRHARNPQRLRRELEKLHGDAGTTPFAGFLPGLAQAPFLAVLYGLFLTPRIDGHANELLSHTLAGVPLGGHLTGAAGPQLLVFLALFVLLAVIAALTRRLTPVVADVPGAGLVRLLPFATVVVASVVPLAAGLYLLASTAWTVAERAAFERVLARRPP